MATWIQSLSWTLIYSLGQGFVVYASLLLVLKLVPSASSAARYRLSLGALTILLGWFAATWWQQYHLLTSANEQPVILSMPFIAGTHSTVQANSVMEHSGFYHSIMSTAQVVFPWLSAFYIVGLLLMLARLSAGMMQLFSLGRTGLSQPGEAIEELLMTLKDRMQVSHSVQLMVSLKAQVPMVVGVLKPMILMPAAVMAQLSTEQLETILLHELAHIKRYDHLLHILCSIIETILFFNPFVWLTSSIMRREMEHCCDDLVVAHTHEPLYYATALASLAAQPGVASSFTLAASGQSNHLYNRIKRIMEMKKNPFSYSRMLAAILIIVVITSSVAWLTPSVAKPRKDKPVAVVATKPATVQPEVAPVSDKEKRLPVAKKEKAPKAVVRPADPAPQGAAAPVSTNDETKLLNLLIGDGLLDQVKGFVVERQQDKLYINGQLQTDEVAKKYLPAVQKENMRIEVFSFEERMKRHPDASFIQVLFPIQYQAGCADYRPAKKPGC